MINAVFSRSLATQHGENLSPQPDRSEHHEIGIADPLDLESSFFDSLTKLVLPVASLVARLNVVWSPQRLECRHKKDRRRIRFQYAADFAEPFHIIIKMFDHIK